MKYDESVPLFYHVEEVLTRPIGECTTNVLGSSVIFTCEGDYINEHVYIDASTNPNFPETPDCSGELLYVMPIRNECNAYDWGSMLATWDGYCVGSTVDPCACPEGTGYDSDTMACVEGSTTRCWECTTMEGCESITCASDNCPEFSPDYTCQCNEDCATYGNCCD